MSLKHFTPKRQALEAKKNAAYQAIARTRPAVCAGCGATSCLSHSHRIPQGDRRHIANPENIDVYCYDCHIFYEAGRLWVLENGESVATWLEETDFQFFMRKMYKMKTRIDDDRLDIENLPSWVKEIFDRLQII